MKNITKEQLKEIQGGMLPAAGVLAFSATTAQAVTSVGAAVAAVASIFLSAFGLKKFYESQP